MPNTVIHSWYAPLLEIVRCLGVLAYYGVLVLDHIGAGPHRFELGYCSSGQIQQ